MKKVTERMDGNVREMQRRGRAEGQGQGEGAHKEKEKEEKKGGGSRWLGLGKKKDKEAAGAGAKDGSSEGAAGPDADDEGLRVEQYLLVFLKFISAITPTIEVDSTASI
ncbi:uncharacterized protein RHOBADRAFT_66694 [Rhodotorula graminis WP1]|uniref:Uncharacterized protein n=1 Tax=Rhodotorula graminis (strain WP1) TaxID=578459 RepID=A0A0P9FDZ8_RHOGW|nr:uncharacterized protein RHOBADRAFT_66694 [Rhodotorula graminis WP1]KPV73986.1 hypothetical protein RHOBADRAFT_66694 [Rhodotorula graminis WP1]